MASGYYPCGAEYDVNAPYNQATDEREFDTIINVAYEIDGVEHEAEVNVPVTLSIEFSCAGRVTESELQDWWRENTSHSTVRDEISEDDILKQLPEGAEIIDWDLDTYEIA